MTKTHAAFKVKLLQISRAAGKNSQFFSRTETNINIKMRFTRARVIFPENLVIDKQNVFYENVTLLLVPQFRAYHTEEKHRKTQVLI